MRAESPVCAQSYITGFEALWFDVMRERMIDRFQEHDADGDGKVTGERPILD